MVKNKPTVIEKAEDILKYYESLPKLNTEFNAKVNEINEKRKDEKKCDVKI